MYQNRIPSKESVQQGKHFGAAQQMIWNYMHKVPTDTQFFSATPNPTARLMLQQFTASYILPILGRSPEDETNAAFRLELYGPVNIKGQETTEVHLPLIRQRELLDLLAIPHLLSFISFAYAERYDEIIRLNGANTAKHAEHTRRRLFLLRNAFHTHTDILLPQVSYSSVGE